MVGKIRRWMERRKSNQAPEREDEKRDEEGSERKMVGKEERIKVGKE